MQLRQKVLDQYQLVAMTVRNVYHGSPFSFSKFEGTGNQGVDYSRGHYFTEDRSEAEKYALHSDEDGYLYTVDLNVTKAFNPRDKTQAKKMAEMLSLTWKDVQGDETWKDPASGATKEDRTNYYIKLTQQLIKKLQSENISWFKYTKVWEEAFLKAGFDAIHDPVKGWWVLLDPTKAKIRKKTKVPFKGYND